MCKRFNIDRSSRTKHNALLDCELLREVYINLLDAKEPKFDLSNNIEAQRLNKTKNYSKTIVKISEDEIKKCLRERVLANEITLALCGSAFKNKGVQAVLDAVIEYLPAPDEVKAIEGINPKTEEATS